MGFRRWNPDAIVFDNNQAYGTPSYWVQYMFRESNGATFLNSKLHNTDLNSVAASAILCHNPLNNSTYLKIKVHEQTSIPFVYFDLRVRVCLDLCSTVTQTRH